MLPLTPGLRDNSGPIRRGQGPVGHDCIEAGWTEWAYFDPGTGDLIGDLEAALARVGDSAGLKTLVKGGVLTSAGRAILASQPPNDPPPAASFGQGRIEFGQGRTEFGQGRIAFDRDAAQFPTFRIATPDSRGAETRFRLTADVLFDFDRAELRPQAEGVLRDVARQIRERGARVGVRVEGHTDALGTDAYNDALSLRRAEAVRSWLLGPGGLPRGAIEAQGVGKRQPVAPNAKPDGSDDPVGRQQNRRVEIVATTRR